MKNPHYLKLLSSCFAFLICFTLGAQEIDLADSTGMPGDNFSLEGALDLFKKSKSPEDFEKKLNSENSKINNLDLNEDGDVDYIRVIDNAEGDAHALVLQVPVSESENQDIAVIEIEKTGSESAILQIIGDEAIYGENVIVEPFEEEGRGGKGGPDAGMEIIRVVVNVYSWHCVSFMFGPTYVVYRSPWRWGLYPVWWRPWRPYPWRWYHTHHIHHRTYYHRVHTHRVVHAHKVYTPRRATSKTVVTRTTVRRPVGNTAVTRKTTTAVRGKGPDGGKVAGKKTTTAVKARGAEGGKVAGKKTTTAVKAQGPNGGKVTAKKTTTGVRAQGPNGAKAGARKTTTGVKAQGPNGGRAGARRTTTGVKAKGRNGRAVAGKKTTTKAGVRKKRN